MLLPHPETDLSLNLMVLGSDIISILAEKKGFVLVETLMEEFLAGDKRRTPDTFFYSLLFLFTFDLIEQKDFKIKLSTQHKKQYSLF